MAVFEPYDLCTIINRTSLPLDVTFNARTYILKPGKNENLPYLLSQFAKNQHPIMGTEDPFVVTERPYQGGQWKVGVEDTSDDLSPIADDAGADKVERISRDEGNYLPGEKGAVAETVRFRPLSRASVADGPTSDRIGRS